MPKRIQVNPGDRYGRLTVIEEVEPYVVPVTHKEKRQFLCQCDCGVSQVNGLRHLRSGASTACRGCNSKTHGMRKDRSYSSWDGMIQRCYNPHNWAYKHYGERGVTVCERWRHSFEAFYADMGERPKRHSIERIDVNGNYEPGNCKWVTQKEQMRNTRRTLWITFNGESKSLGEWAELLGIKYATLHSRLRLLGMSVEDAFTRPVGGKDKSNG